MLTLAACVQVHEEYMVKPGVHKFGVVFQTAAGLPIGDVITHGWELCNAHRE